VEKLVKRADMVTMGKLPQTPRAKKVIEYAIEEARNLNQLRRTEHLLLACFVATTAWPPSAHEPRPEARRSS